MGKSIAGKSLVQGDALSSILDFFAIMNRL